MIDGIALSGLTQATLVVGVILIQAIVLYVSYGVLERVARPLIETITSA